MKTALARGLLNAMGWLPLPLLHGLGWLAGSLLWAFSRRDRDLALLQLRLSSPQMDEAQLRRVARTSLTHVARALTEAPAIWFGPRRRLMRWLHDPATAQQLRHLGRDGAIILSPHLGSWELAGMFCAAHGRITSLYKPQKGVFDALIKEGRQRLGARLVPTSAAGVKILVRALRQGELVGILPDQDPPEGAGAFAPFFGVAAHTPTLASRLAARTGVPVWFCYAERLSWGRGFRVHLRQAPEAIATDLAALNRGVERCVEQFPEQYWWSYRRYRRRPPGHPDVYGRT